MAKRYNYEDGEPMKIFNRKEALSLLDIKDYIEKVESQFEEINKGWVIYWKGKPMKPKHGNNHYFASYEAALKGIDRNVSVHFDIKKDLAMKFYGIKWNSIEWEKYFNGEGEETRKFDSFCNNVLNTVFVKAWLADGTLEIRNV